jgi:alpha-1,2-mannosyltransferase
MLRRWAIAAGVGLLAWWWSRPHMVDLDVYRAGGRALLAGTPLYDAHPVGGSLPFTYPPFAGVACVPLAALPWGAAKFAITAASLVALLAAARATRVPAPLVLAAAALALEPVRATLDFGQVNLLLMAMVLLDVLVRKDRPSAGVLVGLAAAVKLTPLVFIPYLVLVGRRRAAGTAAATFAATVAGGWLLLPADSTRYWFHLVAQPDRVGGVAYAGNQSLLGALSRLTHTPARPEWALAALVVGVTGLLAAAAVARAGRELAGLVLCAVTGLLVSPISWSHHWVWVLPALVALWPLSRAAAAGAALLFTVAPIWWPPGGDLPHRPVADMVAADTYVLAGLTALGAAAAWALRARRASTTPVSSTPMIPSTQ